MTGQSESLLTSLWDSGTSQRTDPVEELVYASNLLGSDKRVTNFGGGNTSSKITMPDPLTGEDTEVLWVKGSGGDLGSASRANFASLYLDKVLDLERVTQERGLHEDDVIDLYRHCVFGLNPTACSIDTPLHAYVPFRAVSHMHSDAVIAIAASQDAERLNQEIWQGEMGFLSWKRPGFDLGLMLRDLIRDNPGIKGALMQSHGFICWADDWQECYELTIRLINRAQEYIDSKSVGAEPFGARVEVETATDPRSFLAGFLPRLRGLVMFEGKRLVTNVDQSEEVLDFLSSEKSGALSKLGTSCPDHFLRTKIRPLVYRQGDDLEAALAEFRKDYAAYYERCRRPGSPAMRNPNPSIVLVPGVGMVALGKNPQEAQVTGEFYRNAIRVMKGAETVSEYVSLPEQEAFDIEYWLLEEAKLKRQPPESDLSRQVAVVTGAAQGIGKSVARSLTALGACVVLVDRDEAKLEQAVNDLGTKAKGSVKGVVCDVTDEAALDRAFTESVLAFGGVDIVIVNAGNARRGTVADTDPGDYKLLSDLLMTAYFETMSRAVRMMKHQGTGGSIVVVGSKNGVAVGSNAALYSAAKAFELHLMRSVAVDHAKDGIRCNAVNPDAVVIGSGIWNDEWRAQTAANLGIRPDEIEAYYRNRTMLKVDVTPDDVAGAVAWLANDKASSRTTGCVITVDGGNREGFLR
ncbi:MAG: bifunctional rhamnulose-1-phosphate aldolase/short-chain dehydrogenase [Armatimonadetes bacterium]|nr:bifunctional rhamnulose-1-phosphate aldolase/short-chain dehydrogenase [Armatimonadota bacterium]